MNNERITNMLLDYIDLLKAKKNIKIINKINDNFSNDIINIDNNNIDNNNINIEDITKKNIIKSDIKDGVDGVEQQKISFNQNDINKLFNKTDKNTMITEIQKKTNDSKKKIKKKYILTEEQRQKRNDYMRSYYKNKKNKN
jgi:hypothetical protein